MAKVKVALIQMDIILGDVSANQHKALGFIDEAVEKQADLIILPELWTTGYDLEKARDLAAKNGSTLELLCEKARATKTNILGGSILEAEKGKVYNTSYYIDAKGNVIGKYRKVHLFGLMDEDQYLAPGEEVTLTQTDFGLFGLMICYDLRFPELARKLTLMGANALLLPAEFPKPRKEHWRILNIARAIENQVFVFAVNRVGNDRNSTFFGGSMIIDPWGEVLVEGSEKEELLLAEVDFSLVEKVRNTIPSLKDRKPLMY